MKVSVKLVLCPGLKAHISYKTSIEAYESIYIHYESVKHWLPFRRTSYAQNDPKFWNRAYLLLSRTRQNTAAS